MFFHQRDKVGRFKPGEGGFREMRVRRVEILRPAMEVCEIATASAGDQDLFARAIGAFKDCDAPAAFACFDRAHQASRPGAQYYRIEFVDHDREEALTANSAANDYCILLI
jgi:hypothetical protein